MRASSARGISGGRKDDEEEEAIENKVDRWFGIPLKPV